MHINDWLARRASLTPYKVALVDTLNGFRRITFSAWNAAADQTARALHDELHVRKGDRNLEWLKLDVAGGSPTPSASLRVDIAGLELNYEGPSGIHDDTTVFLTARQFEPQGAHQLEH